MFSGAARGLPRRAASLARVCAIGLYRVMCAVLPVRRGLVVFDSSRAANYTGSPRAIYEHMVSRDMDERLRCVWFFKRGAGPDVLPGHAVRVRYGGLRYLYCMARAQVWVFDARNAKFLVKRPGQHYIQTWHGTPLKKLGLDMEAVSMLGFSSLEEYQEDFKENAASWDYLIAQNDFSARTFRRCFAFGGELLRWGYPRNDVLLTHNDAAHILALRERLGLPAGKRILLYAPTFRDDEFEGGQYRYTPRLDFGLLREALGDECAILVKYHYLVAGGVDWSGYEGFVYPCDAGAEISELYLVADALITDYSSVMFDYALLRRPMYFYCYDWEKYRDELRGFYVDFEATAPGPISKTTEELVADLRLPAEELERRFGARAQAFYETYDQYDDGRASERVVALIEGLCT